MAKICVSHPSVGLRIAWCLAVLFVAGSYWLPVSHAQTENQPTPTTPEKPAADSPEKPAEPATEKDTEETPPAQEAPAAAPAEEPAKKPKARRGNFLQRLLFGPIADSNDEDADSPANKRGRKRIDPRAPFNQKLSTLLKKAQSHLQAREYRQSLETLQRLLETPDDALWEVSPGKLISVRSAAHKILAKLPADELERYRKQFGGAAQRELQQAQTKGSSAALAQVATRYFQTDAGFQAANQLGTQHLDRGEFGLAAFWFRELLESEAPLTKNPVWRLKAEYVAHKVDAAALQKLLAATTANQKIMVGGQSVVREEWLAKQTPAQPAQTPTLQDWPQFFGSARRVGQASEGEPLLLARWSYPMTYSVAIHERLRQLITDLRDDDQIPIFTFDPLLIDGKIVFRSLRGVKVVSATTGNLLWETADEPAVEDVLAAGGVKNSGEDYAPQMAMMFAQAAVMQQDLDDVPISDNPLTHLLFRNSNHGLLSSDSKRLFVVEDLSVMTNLQPGQYWGEDLPERDALGRPLGINRLTAYDLQTGRSVWELGGPSLNDPFELPLAGSFFFGAPVVDGGDLFVVAEKEGAIRLHALDAITGHPRWSQVIANAQAKISMDVGRQWLSAPVAVGDGVIVCPTTIGWLVAIDRSTHGILWAYRYQEFNPDETSEPQDEALQPAELDERWSPAPPVIVDDRVIFTPPEESRVICLSLSDGREIWSQNRNSSLYMAGVFNGHVVTVGPESISFHSVKQSNRSKTLKFKSPDAHPAGRGVAVQDRYYLPLTTGELLSINLKTQQFEGSTYLPASSKPELQQFGNLAMYHGMLLSLSPHGVAAFEPKLSIVAELQQQLTQDPQSASAAIRQAELDLLNRQFQSARTALRPVQEPKLSNELRSRYRTALVTALSGLVREDLGARDLEFEELTQLAVQPDELQKLERLRAERFLHRHDYERALKVYARFAETLGTQLVTLSETPVWQVRGEQWAAGKIAELFKLAPTAVHPELNQLVEQAVAAAGTREQETRLLNLYRGHPATIAVSKKLVESHVAAGEWQAAENLLLDLQTDPAQRIWTRERLARLWREAKFDADAAHFYRLLERDDAAAKWDETRTVAQFLEEQKTAGLIPSSISQPLCDWHNRELGTVRAGSNFDAGGVSKEFNLQGAGLPYFRLHRLQFLSNEPRFEVIDAASEKRVWSLPVRAPRDGAGMTAQVKVTGHQIVLFEGTAVSALSPTEQRVLWTHTLESHSAVSDIGNDVELGQTPPAVRDLGKVSSSLFGTDSGLGDDWATFASQSSSRIANQRHVCYVSRRELVALDANTGAVLWRRDGLPAGVQILGGTGVLYLWNPGADEVTAYNPCDGSQLNIPQLASLCRKSISSVGDDFVLLDKSAGLIAKNSKTIRLQRFSPLTQSVVWSVELPRKTRGAPLSGRRLATIDSLGQIQLCDLETGTLRPCGTLPKTALRSDSQIYMIPTYDQLLAVVHQDFKFAKDRYGESFPSVRVSGMVHSFDLATGQEQWKQQVASQHLILDHLDHSPIVLLLARTFEQNGSNWKLSVLGIDRQHGRIVHQSDTQVQSSFHQMSVNMREEYVELRTYNDRLRLIPK